MTNEELTTACNEVCQKVHDGDMEGVSDLLYKLSHRATAVSLAVLALAMDDLDSDDRGTLCAWLCEVVRTNS